MDLNNLKNKAKGLYNSAKTNISELVDEAVVEGKRINESIQAQGGYKKVAQTTLDTAVSKIEGMYSNVSNQIFTDGKYDANKVKALVKDGTAVAKTYGQKAATTLVELSKNLGDKVQVKYNELIPTDADLKRYDGIGTKYDGLLFKPHYEKCIKFMDAADKLIPKNVKYRSTVLEDIKLSASGTVSELIDFYAKGNVTDSKKYDVLDKYLR